MRETTRGAPRVRALVASRARGVRRRVGVGECRGSVCSLNLIVSHASRAPNDRDIARAQTMVNTSTKAGASTTLPSGPAALPKAFDASAPYADPLALIEARETNAREQMVRVERAKVRPTTTTTRCATRCV